MTESFLFASLHLLGLVFASFLCRPRPSWRSCRKRTAASSPPETIGKQCSPLSGNELEVTISFHFKHVLIVFENKNVNGSVPKIYLDDDILLGEGDVSDSLRLCYQRRSLHVFQRRDAERVQPLFLLLVGYFTESNKPVFHSLC